jgi:hypothetical protein
MTDVKDHEEGGQAWPQLENLLQMQNEGSYVIECLSEDFRAEAVRGMNDAYDCLTKHPLPRVGAEQVKAMLDDAVPALRNRDLVLCSRKLYRLRRRLANQVAYMLRMKSPYSEQLYPLFGRDESDAS